MTELTIRDGGVALVDDDMASLARYVWRLDPHGYVFRYSEKRIRLSYQVMGKVPAGFVVDHVNRDRLDNRRENLRVIPAAGNAQNRKVHSHSCTGLRGVGVDRRAKARQYKAYARWGGRNHHLGRFATAEEAAAVARAAREKHMPYATD